MAVLWNQKATYGNNDPNVSPYLKTWVYQNGITICGVTGEGTSKELQANWDSPFEGESVGSKFSKLGGSLQSGVLDEYIGKTGLNTNTKGRTSVSTLHSRQVWGGNRPTQFNIVLQLYALSDPQSEVMNALIELEKMASPELNDIAPWGRIPGTVSINIGRNAIYPECIIESISTPLDKEINSEGLMIRVEVNLQIQTMQMINRSQVRSKFG